MPDVLAIIGSARGDSDTSRLLDMVCPPGAATRIDLREVYIPHYEYDRPLDDDGFRDLVAAMLKHQAIVFATPVYWYAMSGLMKVMFDRLTDLVTVRKHLGRQLRGKRTFVVASGADPDLPDGFEVPFRRTAEYLGMIYEGALYAQADKDVLVTPGIQSAATAFGTRIFGAAT